MAGNFKFEKASVYQLAPRLFTPEGTFRAAIKMLPFLAELGPEYIQLEACAQADTDPEGWSKRQKASGRMNPKNSYRIVDYYKVDEEYGTNEDLKDFVIEAHRLGLKVIWDIVYLHCGPNAVFMEEHPDFVLRNEDGSIKYGEEWPFARFDFSNMAAREYLWNNLTGLIEEFDFDGYRCDVGDMVPLDFWEEGTKRIRAIKEDFIMINEGRDVSYFSAFDVNYFFDGSHDAVMVPQGKMTAAEYQAKIEAHRQQTPENGRMLRFIDNHDICSDSYADRHELTCTNDGVDALLVMDFMIDGIPFVFNGYEFADALEHSMFSNRFHTPHLALDWGNFLTERGQKRFYLMQHLFRMRRECSALYTTDLEWVEHNAPDNVMAFIRPDKEDPLFVAINLTDKPVTVEFETIPKNLHLLMPELAENVKWSFKDGKMQLQMLGFGYLAAFYPV